MKANWTPFFWEPVEGTGERLMAGVVLQFGDEWSQHRLLRDDVLDALYGKASGNPRTMIDHALVIARAVCEKHGADGITAMKGALFGLHPGLTRTTEAPSVSDVLRQVALLHSSLAQLDSFDELEEADTPTPEEINKRFATEVRELVLQQQPSIQKYFNRQGQLSNVGQSVRFGFLSDRAVLHFSVIHPKRQSNGLRDARARLWELSRVKEFAQIRFAGLISAVPRDDDPTLGVRELESLKQNRLEIEREADDVSMRFIPVTTVVDAANKVLEVVA
jgi:hypothetical protein